MPTSGLRAGSRVRDLREDPVTRLGFARETAKGLARVVWDDKPADDEWLSQRLLEVVD